MNKSYKLLLLFCVVTFTIVSCSKDEVVVQDPPATERALVDFDIVPGDDPFSFSFENKSSNYKKLEWRFGDDSLSTEVSPQHLYATAGDFQVSLEATAEDGSISRKLLAVEIPVDSVLKLTTVNTDATTLKFTAKSNATIQSLLWTFEDGTTSTELSPSRTYNENTLNNLTVRMTTDKGSFVESKKYATTKGIVTDIQNVVTLQSVSSDNSGGKNAAEGSLKLIDNNVDTKMYQGWPGSFTAIFQFQSEQTVKFYGIGSANDSETRDPKTWTLEGSNDGLNWEVVDTRDQEKNFFAQAGNKWKQMFYFAVANPKSFQYYKWNVTANFGSSGFQLSEFKLFR